MDGKSWWAHVRDTVTGPSVLFSLIWQVFLIYPILGVVTAPATVPTTMLCLVSVAAFSVTYLLSFASPAVTRDFPLHLRRRGSGIDEPHHNNDDNDDDPAGADNNSANDTSTPAAGHGLGHLAVLLLCAFGTLPAGGATTVTTFLPFLACFVSAAWPLRRSVPTSLAMIAAGVITAVVTGSPGPLIPAFLVVPVAMSMAGTRISVGVADREATLRRALGVAEERERMARDLHDVLGHTLTALTIRTQLARALVDTDTAATRGELDTIEDLTRSALQEMRQTVAGLRAADPAKEVDELSRSLRSAGVDVVVVGTPSLVPPAHAELVAWTVREAGTNIARHSGARHAIVEFGTAGLRICDDGEGVDSHRSRAAGGSGQGLRGLAQRADEVGARLTVREQVGGGTVVELGWER